MTTIQVTLSDGSREPINYDKINDKVEKACEGIENVSPSLIATDANLHMHDGITTNEITNALLDCAKSKIDELHPGYQYVTARFFLENLYHEVFGASSVPTRFYDFIKNLTDKGFYDPLILKTYSEEDIDYLETRIDLERDKLLSYSAVRQLYDKYFIQDRVNKVRFEVPQYMMMVMSMAMHLNEKKFKRNDIVAEYYDDVSLLSTSMPTPIMAGVRGTIKQYASCCLIPTGDSLNAINAASDAAVMYGSKRAGLGIDSGWIRAIGSKVGDGSTSHTGIFPFMKYLLGSLKSCSQGGVRGTASTMFFPFWHYEIESLLVLKNNRGTEENRLRHSDYAIKLNYEFYKRAYHGEDIHLFSPNDVPKLEDAFYSGDRELFAKVYEEYIADTSIRRKVISADALMELFVQERSSTGRIYVMNVDHANSHSPFASHIKLTQSNLCMEIILPVRPYIQSAEEGYTERWIKIKNREAIGDYINKYGFIPRTQKSKLYDLIDDEDGMLEAINEGFKIAKTNVEDDDHGEIALCILGALNLYDYTTENLHDGRLEKRIYRLVRALDNLIDLQEYPVKAGEISAKLRRTLGIGVTNYAHFLAKQGLRYSDGSGLEATHQLFEAIQFYAIKASVELAKERGACELFHDTAYSQGILPIDSYNKNVDELGDFEYLCDWEWLRKEILKYGMRHSTLTALMPVESSARVTSSINGIEPPKALFSSKDGIPTVVPDVNELFLDYETMWEISNTGYLRLVAVMQKFVDQSISTNTHYDPTQYEDNKVPFSVIVQDLYDAYYYGIKTLYYHYTNDNTTTEDDADCESCKI